MTEPRRPERPLREAADAWIAKYERELAARPEPPAASDFSRYRELLEFRESLDAPVERRTRRRIAVGVILIVLAFAPLLLTVRLPRTEVHLRIEATETTLRTPGAEPVLESLDLAFAEVSGVESIEVPQPVGPSRIARTATARVEPSAPDAQVRLWELILQEGQTATFTAEASAAYRTRVDAPPQGGQALYLAVDGAVHVRGSGLDAQATYTSPKQIVVQWGGQAATFRFGIPLAPSMEGPDADSLSVALATQIAIDSLSFFRRDRTVQGTASPVVRNVSTILAGSVRYEALDGEERELHAGDGIRFSGIEGIVRTFRATGDRLIIDFHGDVGGMAAGTGARGRSMMPTLFEWLEARHSLRLLWGGLAYLLTLALSLYQWWKSPR